MPLIRYAVRAFGLERRDRTQVLRALGWMTITRTALRVGSYATLRRAIDRLPPRRFVAVPITARECERAVRRAARVLPSASCLAQAVAGACLLRRDGHDSTLTIGVGFDSSRRFRAHAWLEADGVSIIGGDAVCDHRVLLRDAVHGRDTER